MVIIIIRTYTQGPSLLCMNDVLGQLGEIGEIEQEGSDHKVAPIIFIFVIIITRPKQTGSCGQDSNQAGTFRGVLNVSLCVLGALLGLYIVAQIQFFWDNFGQICTYGPISGHLCMIPVDNQEQLTQTLKYLENPWNQPQNMKPVKLLWKTMKTNPRPWKTLKLTWKPWKPTNRHEKKRERSLKEKKPTKAHENRETTKKSHENQPRSMKNRETTLKNRQTDRLPVVTDQ